jgi:hypothetical protein
MQPEASVPCSKEPATGPFPDPESGILSNIS